MGAIRRWCGIIVPVTPRKPHNPDALTLHEATNLTSHPALIVEWVHHRDAQGYPHWMARCFYLRDGEMVAATVPARDVARVG